MTKAIDKLSNLLTTYETLEKQMRAVTARDLHEVLATKLNECGLVAATWTQYTPHYSDGDPCCFSSHIDADSARGCLPKADDFDVDSWDALAGDAPAPNEDQTYPSQRWDGRYFGYEFEPHVDKQQARKFATFVESLPDNLMERVLGDGVRVFVWSGGLLTQEYDHD